MVAMSGDVGDFVEKDEEVDSKGPRAILDFINKHNDLEP